MAAIKIVIEQTTITVENGEWSDSGDGTWAARALRLIARAVERGELLASYADADPDLSRAEWVANFFGGGLIVPPDRTPPEAGEGQVF